MLALGKEDKPKKIKDAIERAQAQEAGAFALRRDDARAAHSGASVDQEIFLEHQRELLTNCATAAILRDNVDVYAGEFDECASAINDGGESKSIAAAPEKIRIKNRAATFLDESETRDASRVRICEQDYAERVMTQIISCKTPLPRLSSRLDNPATLYGRWWHQLLQQLQWKEEGAWDAMFQAALEHAPDRERAEKEWKLFRAHISGNEDFRKRFAADELLTRTEFRFS